MSNEMILRYLYFLTLSHSGTKEWKRYFKAWNDFGNSLATEEYSELMEKVREFENKYRIKF